MTFLTDAARDEAQFTPPSLTAAEESNWRAFYHATNRLLDVLDRDLQHEIGIPLAYYDIFVRLAEAPNRSMRMSDLAQATQSSRSRLSHAVSRLQDNGWVRRIGCTTDRRGQIAQLTSAGKALLDRAAPAHVESIRRRLIDALTVEQLDVLGQVSNIVHNNLHDTHLLTA